MHDFEARAKSRGCTIFYLTTLSFQAPDFYRRQGYTEFARSPDLPVEGEADVHFLKLL